MSEYLEIFFLTTYQDLNGIFESFPFLMSVDLLVESSVLKFTFYILKEQDAKNLNDYKITIIQFIYYAGTFKVCKIYSIELYNLFNSKRDFFTVQWYI